MSRSRKKYPHASESMKYVRFAKKTANKKVRRTKDISNGNSYRRVYNPYDIRDYIFVDYDNPKLKRDDDFWGPRYRYLMK